jgi:thioredoxin
MRYGMLIAYFCMHIYRCINKKNVMKPFSTSILATLLLLTFSCGNSKSTPETNVDTSIQPDANADNNKVVQMTKALFKAKVNDFEKNPDSWIFEGSRPCVIDFYADWCRPCKMVAPLMESFADTYKGQVDIYKVNVDKERELADLFGIRSIPTVLFCPVEGKPQMSQGALSKEDYNKIITKFLLKQTTETTLKR